MDVGLALGAGGARGYAHIGVIAELKERGHRVVAIAGTSMGSVIGGLEAAGRLGEYTEWVQQLTQLDVLRLLDPAFRAPGFIRAERVMGRVEELLDGARIEDLPVPFTAVATDLTARREVWFQRGQVSRAMRASIAIPSAITPVMINGRLLADGGLLNPVPMEPLLGVPADFTLAVNLSGRSVRAAPPLVQTSDEVESNWRERFREAADGLLDNDVIKFVLQRVSSLTDRGDPPALEPAEPPVDDLVFQRLPHELRTADVVSLSFEVASALITRVRMAANPPDVLIDVPLDSARTWDFHRATELIDLGRTLAVEALDAENL